VIRPSLAGSHSPAAIRIKDKLAAAESRRRELEDQLQEKLALKEKHARDVRKRKGTAPATAQE
jgi:hypothetical protein